MFGGDSLPNLVLRGAGKENCESEPIKLSFLIPLVLRSLSDRSGRPKPSSSIFRGIVASD